MREIVHIQAGQCGNQIGAKVRKWKIFRIDKFLYNIMISYHCHTPALTLDSH